jgi:hypothetical protein
LGKHFTLLVVGDIERMISARSSRENCSPAAEKAREKTVRSVERNLLFRRAEPIGNGYWDD